MWFFLNGNLGLPDSIAKPFEIILSMIFWATMFAAIVRYRAHVHWEVWTCRFAFAYFTYISASFLWGTPAVHLFIYPVVTTFLTFFYVNYLLGRTDTYSFNRMMLHAAGILLLLSLILVIAVPSIGLDSGAGDPNNRGAWQGIFAQKNQLGMATALAMAFALGQRSRNLADRCWRVVVFLSALICAIGSQSREAWLAIALQIAAMTLMFLLRHIRARDRPPILAVSLGLSTALGLLIYFNIESAFALLGRSPTASGRTHIWRDSLVLVARRPWLGYGTYGVWKTPLSWSVVVREGWNVPSSHNNYIEILLYYGVTGLILFAPLFLSGFVYSYKALISLELDRYQVHIYVLLALVVLSVASPVMVYFPAIGLLVLLYSACRLEQSARA